MDNEKISPAQVVFPVALLALTLALSLGFQASALLQDRDTMQGVIDQQGKLIEQAGKVKSQANALAVGVLHLAQNGNPDAQNILAQLKKAGVNVDDKSAATAGASDAGNGQPMVAPTGP